MPPLIALFVGAITLAFTIGLCVHERDNEQARLRAVFDSNARQTAGRIEQRIANYEQMLRGVQGLFTAAAVVDPQSFEAYVDTVMAGPDAAGLQSVAFSGLVAPAELPAHIQRMRQAGHANYRIRPDGPRDIYAPIALVAPDSVANRMVLGFDSLSEATRRAAMVQARDSGNATLTGLVQLRVDSGSELRPGCLIFLPVYARGTSTNSVTERRAHGVGWVRAAFRVGDLMSTLYGEQSPGLVVRLHDGTATSEASLMYRSDTGGDPGADGDESIRKARFLAQEYVTLAGHTWTVQLSSLPEFERVHERNASTVILVAGVVLSLLLGVITHQLVTGRARAYAAAQAMTRELRASEERYRRIVDTASEGIWLLDATRRLAFVNPRIAQWLGVTEEAMQGRPVDDFMDPDEAARCRAALAAMAGNSTGEGGTMELRLRRADGTSMWVSLSMRPIFDDAGKPSGALGMLTDINERRLADERRAALETQLRDAQKMEAIGTLAGGIAHDFNNILAAIIGNVAAARQDAAIGLSSDVSLAQIERAAARARSLVQQILTFSRMQAQELHTQALQPVIDEALDMLRAAMPAQVELRVNLPVAPVYLRADATQIQQIVMNLCTNAWHALPAGRGRIEVGLDVEDAVVAQADATSAWPPALLHGPRAHLWIADNGSGMDEATLARVFEPFFTTKQVGQGTGLGLAVVHGIVSVHGGAINANSAPGVGSRFDLWFPLEQAPQDFVESQHGALDAPRGKGEHVLCVDDDPAMVLMVDGLLRRAGYRVTTFEQPAAALARVVADAGAFDIVVTDFNMPEMNGMEFATAVMRLAPDLPIIITSGFISDEMRQQAGELCIGALLQKEYTLERLAGLVHTVLEQHRE
ncbi:MAG: CHASE domain-containing protein [Burkholderiaceae bacterium]